MGLPLFDKGFVNFTVEKQYQQFHPVWRRRRALRQRLNQPVAQNTVTGVGSNGVATLSSVGNRIPNSLLPE